MKNNDRFCDIEKKISFLEDSCSEFSLVFVIYFLIILALSVYFYFVSVSLRKDVDYLKEHEVSDTERYCVKYYLENNYILQECELYRSKLESVKE